MEKFLQKNVYLITLWILCAVALVFFMGHYGNIWLDVGREVYYPERVLAGKILYKDLFVIYGPLAYLWNAVLYKILGTSLSTLYISGVLCSFAIVTAIYLIATRFLNKFLSFAIGIFTLATGVCSTTLFNFTFPYSWAMLYGTVLSLYSLLCLFKLCETQKNKYLYLAAFLSGAAVACKYDFLLYSLIVGFIILKSRDIKIILKSLLAFCSVPLLAFGFLFVQGLNIQDILYTVKILKSMTETHALDYFYKHSGVYFSLPILIYWVENFIKVSVGLGLTCSGVYLWRKNSELASFIVVVGVIVTYFLTNPAIFAFLIGAVIILALVTCKKIVMVKPLSLLVLSAVALSIKSLWGLTPLNYGNYYCALVLMAFCGVLFTLLKKDEYQKAMGIFILTVSLWFGIFYARQLPVLQTKIDSLRGDIYTTEEHASVINETLSLLNSTPQNTSVVVYPEGLIVNFLSKTSRISDDYFNSLLPLYVETFGEQVIIDNFEQSMPNYILFTNQNMSDYNSGYICRDYAQEFCKSVMKKYRHLGTFGEDFGIAVFKKMDVK